MKAKVINQANVEGYVYGFDLAVKTVQNKESANFGKEFINGNLDVQTDEEGMNIVSVHFSYVTATTKAGAENRTYTALKNIIDAGKTVLVDGKDAATKVRINTAIDLNDFVSRDGEMISAKRLEGGFVTIVSKITDDLDARHRFDCDMFINGTRLVEADPEKNIDADYLVVKGAVFNFRNALLPVEFIVKNPGGMQYFESLEASSSNPTFIKVWGLISVIKNIVRREEESAFGEPSVKEYESTKREWIITGAAKESYEIGNAEQGITSEDIQKAMQDRETHLAEVKASNEAYKASQGAAAPANAGVSAAQGGFNF